MHAAALQGHRDIVALLLDRDGNRNLAEKVILPPTETLVVEQT